MRYFCFMTDIHLRLQSKNEITKNELETPNNAIWITKTLKRPANLRLDGTALHLYLVYRHQYK